MIVASLNNENLENYKKSHSRFELAFSALEKLLGEKTEVQKIELIMNKLGITKEMRPPVIPALEKAAETNAPAVAIELTDGMIITGRTSELLGTCSAMLLNSLKYLAGIPDDVLLISPTIIEPIQHLKINHMGNHNPRLHMDEILIALAVAAVTDENAALALAQLPKLRGAQAHSTVLLSRVDENVFKKLGVSLTCEPQYQTQKLYHG